MPMLSAAMYLSQFSSPFIMSVVKTLFGRSGIAHLPFWFAAVLAVVLVLIAVRMSSAEAAKVCLSEC